MKKYLGRNVNASLRIRIRIGSKSNESKLEAERTYGFKSLLKASSNVKTLQLEGREPNHPCWNWIPDTFPSFVQVLFNSPDFDLDIFTKELLLISKPYEFVGFSKDFRVKAVKVAIACWGEAKRTFDNWK